MVVDVTQSESRPCLNDIPDWIYLLREFYEIYRFLSSGGSNQIRAHQRTVREAISRVINSNGSLCLGTGIQKPVTRHLRRALDEGRMERHSNIIRSIEAVQAAIDWQYGYEKVPRGLKDKYAYAELCGPSGPVICEEVILGLVLFAPNCTYPSHAHDGITESYVCLSGAVSENHQGVYAPGSMIFNPPGQRHRITVSNREPALMAYAWVGPKDKLADQKMVFSRK
ncbi:MAG: dimethylsulfonioproprionate lyase family protein [Hyphomicrobiales bacterium]|jgi:dimethylpropiothetin dethiomethylase